MFSVPPDTLHPEPTLGVLTHMFDGRSIVEGMVLDDITDEEGDPQLQVQIGPDTPIKYAILARAGVPREEWK